MAIVLKSAYAATCIGTIDCAYPECGGALDVFCFPAQPAWGLPTVCKTNTQVECPCPSTCYAGRQLNGCGCRACDAGAYCSAGLPTPCTICVAGVEYSGSACSSTANTQCRGCKTCGVGQLHIASCQSTADTVCGPCTPCPAGAFQLATCHGTTDSMCGACANGTYSPTPGALQCSQCPVNRYCSVTASFVCPNGTYSLPGASDISQCHCPANASAGLNCTCNAGFIKVLNASAPLGGWQCDLCGAGTFATTRCMTCPAHHFCPTAVSLVSCPNGTYSTPGAKSADQCSAMDFVGHAVSSGASVFYDATGNATLQFKQSGSFTLSQSTLISLLLVGGGGAGGSGGGYNTGGGGGAGAVLFYADFILGAGFYNVTIGGGGQASSIENLFAASCGGAGGSFGAAGGIGGSGGGSSGGCYVVPAVAGVGQSNIAFGEPMNDPNQHILGNGGGVCGGVSLLNSKYDSGGGGGGAGYAGSSIFPRLGGDGVYNATINGSIYVFSSLFGQAYTTVAELYNGNYYIAGGGTGSANNLQADNGIWDNIRGGFGGGGMAAIANSAQYSLGHPGSPNTGGGGGGGGIYGQYGGLGGSGLALLRLVHTMPCAPGSYADAHHTSCSYCDVGTFSWGGDVTACTNCSVGLFAPLPGAANCSKCPTNYYCNASSATPCPNGTYSWPGAENASQCICPFNASFVDGLNCACDPGFETRSNPFALGGWLCKPCDAGAFASVAGVQNCTRCPANSFCNQTFASPCRPGMQSSPGATNANQCSCPANASYGLDNCTCFPGFQAVDSVGGGWQCNPCSAGTFASLPGAVCSPCPSHHYCSLLSAFACPNGTYSWPGATSISQCVCPANSSFVFNCTCNRGFQRVANASVLGGWQCDLCGLGTYNCRLCAANHYCDSISSISCPRGTYAWPGAAKVSQCVCPANASYVSSNCTCDGGFQSVTNVSALGGWQCNQCSIGTFMFQSKCILCPGDHYCDLVSSIRCPNGTYSWPGSANVSQCGCPGNASYVSSNCTCDGGFKSVTNVSALGGWQCNQCSIGTYLFQSKCIMCPGDHYCDLVSSIRCPNGTYSWPGSANVSQCGCPGNASYVSSNCTCDVGYNAVSNASVLGGWQCNAIQKVYEFTTTSSIGVSESHYTVCSNISFYVTSFCDGLQLANPLDTFTCIATALDGEQCPCACNASRRLLEDYTRVTIVTLHELETVLPPAKPVWMVDVIIDRTCPVSGCVDDTAIGLTQLMISVVAFVLVIFGLVLLVMGQCRSFDVKPPAVIQVVLEPRKDK